MDDLNRVPRASLGTWVHSRLNGGNLDSSWPPPVTVSCSSALSSAMRWHQLPLFELKSVCPSLTRIYAARTSCSEQDDRQRRDSNSGESVLWSVTLLILFLTMLANARLTGDIHDMRSRTHILLTQGSKTPCHHCHPLGTQAFVSAFTTALAEEARAHNIIVQNPNTQHLEMILVPTPATSVRSMLSKAGSPCGTAL